MRAPRLTELAQRAVSEAVHPGDRAIDATVGNGHDTLFLAGRVAPGGRVVGFDVQPQALDAARARLHAAGLDGLFTPVHAGHEQMIERVPADWRGRVAAVMFNLGYLPGGDKTRVTRAETTLAALEQALALLRVGGLVSLLVYRGHTGGGAEAAAVADRVAGLDGRFAVTRHASPGPLLYLVVRRR